MKKVILVAVAVAVAALVVPALASASVPTAVPTGFLEICKHSDSTAPVTGPFTFTVDGHQVVVLTGQCSAPLQVPAGNHTVVEASNTFTAETATDTIPQADLVSSNLSTRTDVVTVAAGDISTATTVEYTNKEMFGTLEICKSAAQGSGLTGTFTFEVKGPMGFDKVVSGVPVGACSDSFRVPAGTDQVNEIGSNNTDLVAVSTIPSTDLLSDNLAADTTEVNVPQGTDVNNEVIETFVNSTSRLKICKIAGASSLNGTVYSFTVGGNTYTAVAEPFPGSCVLIPTPYPGGTVLNIHETAVPGTAVSAINVTDNRAVPGSTDLNGGNVSVTLGSGETDVFYTNVPAAPGLLKVCKNAGTGVTVGQVFKFTIGGQTLSVPAGFCAIAGSFPLSATETITETPTTGLSVIGEAVDPSADFVSDSLSAGTITATISAGVTEVTFTNATAGTPPLPVIPPATGTGSGTGSGTGATTPAPTVVPVTLATLPGITALPVVDTVTPPIVGGSKPVLRCVVVGRVSFVHHRAVLTLTSHGSKTACFVLVNELNARGRVVGNLRRLVRNGHAVHVMLARKAMHVRLKAT